MSETVRKTALPTTDSLPSVRHRLDKFDAAVLLLLVATYVVVAMLPFGPKKFGDRFFHDEAKDLSLAVRGVGSWQHVAINHAPAPVFYYAIPYLVVPAGASDNTYWLAAFSWNILWMAVCLLLIRRCGELLSGPLTGKLAATLSLLSPFSVYYSYGVLAESVGYLGVVLFTYGFLAWKHAPRELSKSRWYLFLFSAGLLTLVLSRPNAVLFLFFALVVGAILFRSKDDIKKLEGRFV